jgi:antirestriction protein ArdC
MEETTMQKTERTERQDVYTRITAQIVADLEKGVHPWVKPWNAEHAAGRITRPLRHNGQPYSGINILSLWMSATAQNFAAPIWMTFRQALELDAHVRKGSSMSNVPCTRSEGLLMFMSSVTGLARVPSVSKGRCFSEGD